MAIITSSIVPITESRIHGEFCPNSNGSPKAIKTLPIVQNNLHMARLYFFKSLTSNIFAFAQNPTGFLENSAKIPNAIKNPPVIHHIMNPIIVPDITAPP